METPKIQKKAENISTAQIERIRRNLRFAILTLTSQAKDKEQIKKDLHGLKYKSSNTKKVFLSVPKRRQKTIIDKKYLEELNKLFNRNGKTKYKLEIVVSKPKIWIPILAGGLATTLAASGTAIYFALTPVMYTMTLNLNGGNIPGSTLPKDKDGNTLYEIKKGSHVSEIPKPVKAEMVFKEWFNTSTNKAIGPSDEITSNMKLMARYENATKSVQVTFVPGEGAEMPGGETQSFLEGTTVERLPIPIHDDGKVFASWYYSDPTQGQKDDPVPGDTVISQGLTIYADWAEPGADTIAVTLQLHGGSIIGDTDPVLMNVTLETTFGVLPTPKLDDYVFTGWWSTPAGQEGQKYDDEALISEYATQEAIEIHARYEAIEHTYSIEGGSRILTISDSDGGEDAAPWVLYKDGIEVEDTIAWDVEDEPNGVTITDGGLLKWVNVDIPETAEGYDFDVTASINDQEVARTEVHLDVNPAKVHISFVPGTTDVVFTGKTELDVIMSQKTRYGDDPGEKFGDFKPSATKDKYHLTGWEFVDGGTGSIDDNTVFIEDATIKPILVPDTIEYTVTGGSTFLQGTTNVDGVDTNAWKLVNQFGETITQIDGHNVTFAINETTLPEGIDVGETTGIVSWTNITEPNVYTFAINAIANGTVIKTSESINLDIKQASAEVNLFRGQSTFYGGNVEYESGAVISFTPDTNVLFGDFKKLLPTPIVSGHPELILDGWSLTEGDDDTLISDTDSILDIIKDEKFTDHTIYPYFIVTPVESLEIVPDGEFEVENQIITTEAQRYKVVATPSTTITPEVTWGVDKWVSAEGESADPDKTPTIDENGIVTTYNEAGTLTIKATPTDTSISPITKVINVMYPYEVYKDEIWTYGDIGEGTIVWGSVDQNSLSGIYPEGLDPGIYVKPLHTSSSVSIALENFDLPLYIGDDITSIKNNFLIGCTNYNSPIKFGADSKCVIIGDNFIAGDVDDPEGEIIMQFNSEITLPPKLENIGDYFLSSCTSFNQTLDLPNTLNKIGDNFMYNCWAFNQPFELSENITKIGNDFMYACDSFTSVLTINCKWYAFVIGTQQPLSFATQNQTPDWLAGGNTGIKIRGDDSDNIQKIITQIFTSLVFTTDGYNRNLVEVA